MVRLYRTHHSSSRSSVKHHIRSTCAPRIDRTKGNEEGKGEDLENTLFHTPLVARLNLPIQEHAICCTRRKIRNFKMPVKRRKVNLRAAESIQLTNLSLNEPHRNSLRAHRGRYNSFSWQGEHAAGIAPSASKGKGGFGACRFTWWFG
jgi:hypothetical protein